MLKNENNCHSERGITLIALVVTIVVLLILAGVTITMIFSNNGVIKKAQEAANKTNEAKENDLAGLNDLSDQLDNALGNDVSSLAKLIATNKAVTENTTVTDKAGKTLIIPAGFKVLTDGAEVNKGVVIEDTKGNQFVWVPVPDPSTMYEVQNGQKVGKLYDFSTSGTTVRTYPGKNTGYREPDVVTGNATGNGTQYDGDATNLSVLGLSSTAEFATQLQTEFDQMITSVEKYKGFYIGRYNTGNLVANTTTEPVVKKGQTAISNVNWYYMYQNSKKIASGNNNVLTSMIWGCQWDRTLQWLVESGNKTYAELIDSRSWGNHADSTGTAATGSGTKQSTGSNEAWKANNIYDLAGNVWKWTIEAGNISYRANRGGSYSFNGSNVPASHRNNNGPHSSFVGIGSVSTLIIK